MSISLSAFSLASPTKILKVPITNAQIIALGTTDFEVIPAPGSGKLILFSDVLMIVDAKHGIYGNLSRLAFNIGIWGVSSIYDEADQGMFADNNTVNAAYFATFQRTTNDLHATWALDDSAVNQALKLHATPTLPGVLTGGHASNHGMIICRYSIVPWLT